MNKKMNKKMLVLILIVVVLLVAWYFFNSSRKAQEGSGEMMEEVYEPNNILETSVTVISAAEANRERPAAEGQIKDQLNKMEVSEMKEFDKATQELQGEVVEMFDNTPLGSVENLSQGTFFERAHEVSGKASLLLVGDKKVLRLEDFETVNGPGLHVYLAAELGDIDYVDLGELKGTKGNMNYDVDNSVDTDTFNKVLIWSESFKVLFSYAQLR